MKVRFSCFKVFDLLAFSSLIFIFVCLPVSKQINKSKVKSATTSVLVIPQLMDKAVNPPELTAQSVYIYDPDSMTTLYEKAGTDRVYPASTTKLVTAMTALENYHLDDVLTVKSAGNVIGQTMKLVSGDRLTFENLLYGLLVDSGNDAGLVLAENFPGGYTNFINRMNGIVKKLGLNDTHFTNTTGLENPDHFTTAKDMTIIANETIRNAVIRKIVSTKEISFTDVTGEKKFFFESTNKLLGMDGVKGIKTGWTPKSGECLISLVTRDGKSVIITVLNSKDRFGESVKLIDWVYDNFSWEEI